MRRRLGRTGYEVFPLGLGGHTYPVGGDADAFATPDERAALVRVLVDGGVNYFDTTWMNEVELLADSFRRADVGAGCVVSLQYVDGLSDPQWPTKLRSEVESRLAVMEYSVAPLFLMGIGNGNPSYAELVSACEALGRLKAEGLIRRIGFSCHQLGYFPFLARLIRETDLVDYAMLRFNWKHQDASEELLSVAQAHDVGVVAMKVFCWDCGPGQWGRRISVFEPTEEAGRCPAPQSLSAAQRSLVWTLQNPTISVAVPAMNSIWEARQNLQALQSLGTEVYTSDFPDYAERLWSEEELRMLADGAESNTIRARARELLP